LKIDNGKAKAAIEAEERLRAAAPDLLAACKALLKQHEREGRHRGGAFPLTAIEAAVAKAEGAKP
jgi:hypothetical protein